MDKEKQKDDDGRNNKQSVHHYRHDIMECMGRVKHLINRFSEPVFLFIIFWAAQLPLRDFDIWFHIKAGEYFAAHGLNFVEPFSFSAQGREWIAFEWLYQIIVYRLSTIGLWIIPLFTSVFIVATVFIFLKTLQKVFHVPLGIRLLTASLFFVMGYEFMTSRPHILAYTCLFLELSLILFRIVNGKRYLYILPILTLFWTNIHSTGFLSWGLLAAYFVIIGFSYLVTKKKSYLPILKDLCIVGILCAVVTILPPKGLRDYRLLWDFYLDRKFLADFIAEWGAPFADFLFGFIMYSVLTAVAVIGVVWVSVKKHQWIEHLWTVPFFIISFVGFTASRNIYIGFYTTIFLLAWLIPHLLTATPPGIKKPLWGVLIISLVVALIWLYPLKRNSLISQRLHFPVGAAEFAKKYLSGRMFNEYTYGGFMLYSVYPKLQIFLDGRAEVFHRYEMRDYLKLAENKYLPDSQYKQYLDSFFKKYAFDFFIMSVQKHVVMRRIGALLSKDPTWTLVYWDDDSEIFVRKNGKNDAIINKLEAKTATPYLRDPFEKTHADQALFEYDRMDKIIQSARTSNALGYIFELQGDLTMAKNRFMDAVNLDPTFESPYMNLAELAVHDGDFEAGINLYTKAQTLAPDRGLIYIRLGQLMLEQSPDSKEDVRRIWQTGIKNTIDTEAQKELSTLLSKL
jgi:tetratricopeptide (TPR) repeat protein